MILTIVLTYFNQNEMLKKQIEADDLENDLTLDMDVETIIGIVRKAKDGTDIYSYKFRAIKK